MGLETDIAALRSSLAQALDAYSDLEAAGPVSGDSSGVVDGLRAELVEASAQAASYDAHIADLDAFIAALESANAQLESEKAKIMSDAEVVIRQLLVRDSE